MHLYGLELLLFLYIHFCWITLKTFIYFTTILDDATNHYQGIADVFHTRVEKVMHALTGFTNNTLLFE